MPIALREAFFDVLSIPAGSGVRESITRTADAFFGDSPNTAAVMDLFAAEAEVRKASLEQLAAAWISAKFWGVSLQRVSLMSLLSDMIHHIADAGEVTTDSAATYDTDSISDELRGVEFDLLRRKEYIVPIVSL